MGCPTTAIALVEELFQREFRVPYDDAVEGRLGTVVEKADATSLSDGRGYGRLFRNEAGSSPRSTRTRYRRRSRNASPLAAAAPRSTISQPTPRHGSRPPASTWAVLGAALRQSRSARNGRFIDEGGNNFWGVEQFTFRGDRLIALSDRDFGLYVFDYTGPGSDD